MVHFAMTGPPGVHLREITFESVREIIALRVAPEQAAFVAPNAVSIAEGLLNPGAWLRSVHAGGEAVGFVMLLDPGIPGCKSRGPVYPGTLVLWRLMIDGRHQKRGYAKAVLDQVCDRARMTGARAVMTSYIPGAQGPEHFYARYGFKRTGRLRANGSEVELQLEL